MREEIQNPLQNAWSFLPLTGVSHDRDKLVAGMLEAFDGDPAHGCTGRSAPARLARAIQHADEFGLAVPTLRALAA